MSDNIEVCFESAQQQNEASKAAGRLTMWTSDPGERTQLTSLTEPYSSGRRFVLTPGIFAAIYCSGVRPTIVAVPDEAMGKQDFLIGPDSWSLYRVTEVDQVAIGKIKRRLGSSMFGPAQHENICLLGDQINDVQEIEESCGCTVEPTSLGELLTGVRT